MNSNDFQRELDEVRKLIDKQMDDLGISRKPALDRTPARLQFTAGALLRRSIRWELIGLEDHGISFTEHKGLLESLFVVRGPKYKIDLLQSALQAYFED